MGFLGEELKEESDKGGGATEEESGEEKKFRFGFAPVFQKKESEPDQAGEES
jgi:hypothetical protein